MQIYLNTYSLSPQNPPLRNQQLLNTFLHYRDLCQLLMEWKVDVLTDTEKRTLVVGGHIVTDLMGYMTTPREKQIAMLVKGVYDRYFKQNIPNSSVEFSLKRSFDRHDVGVSYSYEKTLPVISFDYDSVYCSDVVNGFVRACGASGAGKPAHVKNLYDANKKVENLLALQTFKACQDLSPKDCPMWNQTALTRYFDLIEHDKIVKDMIPMGGADRIKTLREYAPMVALLNGWEYNPTLSHLNSSSRKPREIFTSRYFASQNYYLSIDFEKSDFVFELIDTKGEHIKEINWRGEKTGEKKNDHGIKLKK